MTRRSIDDITARRRIECLTMRRYLLATLAIAGAVALAGCSYGSPASSVDVLACAGGTTNVACPEIETIDFEGMLSEWKAHVATLVVRAGAELQPPRESELGDEEQWYESGFGDSLAPADVICAWKGEWLALDEKQSLDYLRELVETDESMTSALASVRDLAREREQGS